MTPLGNDRGYALVVAVLGLALFAYLAFEILAANRGAVALAASRVERARLMSAADAGVALAIRDLGAANRGDRWSADGRPREMDFDGFALTVTVEDELAKAPVNTLSDQQIRALFAGAGAKGEILDLLVAEYREWVTDPTAMAAIAPGRPRANGALFRGAPMLTLDEFALLRDMTPKMFARITQATTVFPDDGGGFRSDRAQPLARATMAGLVSTSPEEDDLAPSTDGDRPALDLADSQPPVGDPMTVRVTARDRRGGVARRLVIVEFTGDQDRPYWIRFAD